MSGLEQVLIAAAIVFVLNAVGSFIEFNNRFVNALVDTVLLAVVLGALVHFGYLHMAFTSAVPATAPSKTRFRDYSHHKKYRSVGKLSTSALKRRICIYGNNSDKNETRSASGM